MYLHCSTLRTYTIFCLVAIRISEATEHICYFAQVVRLLILPWETCVLDIFQGNLGETKRDLVPRQTLVDNYLWRIYIFS